MLDKIFKFLIKESTEFMEINYLHPCNIGFRTQTNSFIKSCVLSDLYSLEPISVDFEQKGLKAADSLRMRIFDGRINYAPIEAFYKIKTGLSSIAKLIMIYNTMVNGQQIFSVKNDLLVIKGNINHWIDVDGIEKMDVNSVVASSFNGGEERLKELVNEINDYIVKYNKTLFDNACAICNN